MPSLRFTAKWIRSVKPPATGQVDYFDSNRIGDNRNFGLRVSYGGKKSWFILYRHHGRQRRLTLGSYPKLGLADAREAADEQVSAILGEQDPAGEKQSKKRAKTFTELAEDYIEQYAKPRKRSWEQDAAVLRRDLIPRWTGRKAYEIRRRDVRAALARIVDRGAPVLANNGLGILRKVFNWALEIDEDDHQHPIYYIQGNPCSGIRPPAEAKSRERVLTTDEIATLWKGLEESPISLSIQLALKLMLVTAQRNTEVRAAAKSEFDLTAGWWTIPGERAKNGMAHRVPLSPLARTIVETAWHRSGESPYLFPSPMKAGPTSKSAVTQALLRHREGLGVAHWVPHDLRRSAASHMTGSGIARLAVSKILNHVEGGVTAVYDRHSYDAEKRQALDSWGRRLQAVVSGEANNVVEMTRA